MSNYLSSVENVVGSRSIKPAHNTVGMVHVPISFLKELEALRARVNGLDGEVRSATLAELH